MPFVLVICRIIGASEGGLLMEWDLVGAAQAAYPLIRGDLQVRYLGSGLCQVKK